MHTHPNARLTPLGRERLLRRHIDHGENLAFLAAQSGINVRSAYKWLARYRSGGAAALDPLLLQRAVDLRHERCTLRRVARVLAAPLSTVGRVLKPLGLIPKRTRSYTPRTNGKAERFIKTLLAEWAYSMAVSDLNRAEPLVAALSGDL